MPFVALAIAVSSGLAAIGALAAIDGLVAAAEGAPVEGARAVSTPAESAPGESIPTQEEQAVLAAVQQFFDGMAANDPEMIAAVVMAGGQLARVRDDGGNADVGVSTFEELMNTIAVPEVAFLERMWDAQVSVRGRLASVWTPYDFHRNGDFSHCGIDAFNLIETNDGWRIAHVAYTVEPTGCPPSPLGPPGR